VLAEWFMGLMESLGVWFLELMPADAELEDFAASASGVIQDALDAADGMGAWLDWAYALFVAGLIAAVWLVGLVIKVVRWIVGLIPTMGGGT
jgi:hypothetical protein